MRADETKCPCQIVAFIEEFIESVVAAAISCNDLCNLNVNRAYMNCNHIVKLIGCSGGWLGTGKTQGMG